MPQWIQQPSTADHFSDALAYAGVESSLEDFMYWLDANPEKDPLDYDGWRSTPSFRLCPIGAVFTAPLGTAA